MDWQLVARYFTVKSTDFYSVLNTFIHHLFIYDFLLKWQQATVSHELFSFEVKNRKSGLVKWAIVNSLPSLPGNPLKGPGQTASDQCLHCLLTGFSTKIE